MKQICRVCGRVVGSAGWASHILKHKTEFAKVIGRSLHEAGSINWEDVVLFYNPKNADKKKCIGYPIPKDLTKLEDFSKC